MHKTTLPADEDPAPDWVAARSAGKENIVTSFRVSNELAEQRVR